jgi:hypothetical protein
MVDVELEGQTVRIPEFAMDKSIQTLIQLAKRQGLDITSIEKSDKRTATVLSRMEKILTGQKEQLAKQTKESQKGIQAQKKESSETAKVRQAIDNSTKSNSAKLEQLAEKLGDKGAGGMLGGIVGKLGPFAKFLSVGSAALAGFATAITTAFKFLMRLGQLEGTLFRTGFFSFDSQEGLAQGITSLTVSASNARLSLEQATEILTHYSKAMDAYGSETILSAITNTQNLLEAQGFLAMNYQEIAQAVAEQGQIFAQAGLSVGANGVALANHSTEVLRTTQAFSDLTNTSADLIRTMVLQASTNQVFLNRLQMLPESIRQSTLASAQEAFAGLAAFGEQAGGELTRILSEGIGFGNLAFSQSFRDLVVTSPQLADALYNLQNTIIGGGNVVDSMEVFRKTVLNVSDTERERLQALSIMGDQQAGMVLQLINQQRLLTDETNNFIAMRQKASNLKPEQLANIQARLQAALAELSTRFQKLAASLLTDNVVSTFGNIMDAVIKLVKKLGEQGGFIDTIGNKITQALHNSDNFIKKVNDFFTNTVSGFTSFISTALSGGISAGISRGVALAIKGGTNADDLATYDRLVEQYKNATNEKERSQILSQLADAAGVSKSYTSKYGMYEDGSGDINTSYSPLQLQQKIKEEIGKFYSGGDPFSNAKEFGPPTGIVNPNQQGTQESDGMTGTSRQKIRILPMFGDPTSYLEKKPMTQEEYQKKSLELTQEGNETLRLIAMGQKTQTTVQEKNLAFKKFKGL